MALEGGEGSALRPGRSLPLGKTQYPLYRRLRGPQGRPGQVRKISPPSGFDPRTVQPVASRYTDYTTWPTRQTTHTVTSLGQTVNTSLNVHAINLVMCISLNRSHWHNYDWLAACVCVCLLTCWIKPTAENNYVSWANSNFSFKLT
jgi:hypothetical protein